MDKFSVINRNDSESSDASDIDLDDIAKMIDPLDDLEDNLFSNKAKQTSKKNSQASSLKKVMESEGKSLIGKDTEEIEILTSMSSNNGQQVNMKFEDDIFGGLLKSQQSEKQAGMSNANAKRDEKRGTLKKAYVPDSKVSDVHEDLKTGLWSGDDLWNLGRDAEKLKQTAGHSPSISPVKSHKETGPHSFNSPTRSPKSFSIVNPGFGQRRRSNNSEITASGNKKPGKFDWLGLLESSDEEKQLSKKSNDRGVSLHLADSSKEESHEISGHKVAGKNNLLGNSNFNNEGNPKVSADFSSRRESTSNQNTVLLKDSFGEDAHNVIPKMTMETTGSKMQQEMSSLLPVGKDIPEAIEDTTQTQVYGKKESETSSHHSLAKGKSSLMEDFSGPSSKKDGRLKEQERETINEKSSMSKKGSISEENEVSSAHAYAPTFIGDKSESSGRRRRRNESREVAGKTKEAFSAIFDPLGLFLMDDKDKLEVNGSENKSLPEWLTGAKNKSKVENQSSSPVEKKRGSMSSPESKRDVTIDTKLDSTKVEDIKSLSASGEPSEKDVGGEEAKLVVLNDGDRAKIDSKRVGDIALGERNLSLGSKKSSEEEHFTQEKSINKISKGEKVDRVKLSLAGEEDRGRNITKKNAPHSEEKFKEIGSDSDEHLERKDLRRRKSIKESLPKKKRYCKGKEGYESEDKGDHSSVSIKDPSFDRNSKKFAEKEKYYLRKIRALEEKAIQLEFLEDELAQMNHLKGEVEHMRAVIHMLELEKSATESLITSLQERHSEQIKRLEEVHRNEVKSLKEALSREEKRGAEEVGRLAEDHRKTIDRLMETNVRMEEEFRNRMLEARRDWSRDMEAMRLAYQQSSNAAITNASLAVLTGHGIGSSEYKDKSEISKKDDSSTKLLSQCPEEVKGLSKTVERVETILMETLEAITPKVKKQSSKAVVSYAIEKGNQPKVGNKSVRDRRKAHYKVVSPRKRRRFIRNEKGRTHSRDVTSDEYIGEHLESDCSQQLGGVSSRDSVIGSHSLEVKKKNIRNFSKDVCQYCKRCQHCRRKSSSPIHDGQRQKSDKEGRNVDEYIKESLRDKLQKDYGNGEKVFRKFNKSYWLNRIQERKNLSPASARMTVMNDDYFSTVLSNRQPGVIIDPKQYLMKLASGNRNNLFQPLDVVNV